jgi:hypothetical protein
MRYRCPSVFICGEITAARSAARPTVIILSEIPPLSNREECYNPPLAERMTRRLLALVVCVES